MHRVRGRAAGLIGWFVAALTAGACRPPARSTHPYHAEAAAIVADLRPFLARLADAGRHRSCPASGDSSSVLAPIGCGTPPDPATVSRAAGLAARIRADPGATTNADLLWAAALLDLALTPPDAPLAWDQLVARFGEITTLEPSNGSMRNDAAIAHLARMAANQRPDDLGAALTEAAAAVRLDSASATAWTNLGLILERFHFTHEAERAWTRAAALEPDRAWNAEIEAHRSALHAANAVTDWSENLAAAMDAGNLGPDLVGEAARADAEAVRTFILGRVLVRWSQAVMNGQPTRDSVLATAERAAALAASVTGDSLPWWIAAAARSASGDARRAARLARGFLEADSGRRLFDPGRYAEAVIRYRAAAAAFDDRSAPKEASAGRVAAREWVGIQLGLIAIYQGDYHGADAIHHRILSAATRLGPGAGSLKGFARWGLGISWGRRGDLSKAVDAFAAAVPELASVGDRVAVGVLQTGLADGYDLQGLFSEAFRIGLEGQAALGRVRRSRAAAIGLNNFGHALERMGATVPALFAQRESVAIADLGADESARTEAYLRLAQLLAKVGARAEALVAIDSARSSRRRYQDPFMAPRLTADLDESEATLILPDDPHRAETLSDSAARFFERMQLEIKMAPVLATRGRARMALGDTAAALVDLRGSERLSSRQLGGVRSGARRYARSNRGDVFRTLLAVSVRAGDTAATVDLVLGGTPPRDAGTATLGLSVLADRVVQVVGLGDRRAIHETAVPRDSLERLIAAIEKTREWESAGRELYRLLIAPVAAEVAGARRVVIVADPMLASVPFAGLPDPRTGRFLVEDMAVAMTSAAGRVPPRPAGIDDRVLLVDASRFDRARFPELAELRFAGAEVAGVREAYPAGRLTVSAGAGRARVLEDLGRYPVVHMIGHARSVRGRPGLSHFVLGAAGAAPGGAILSEADLAHTDLGRVRVVVLSSCGTTAADDGGVTETGGGLPEALLRAGAGAVVSSAWEVDDEAAAALMARFHRALRTMPIDQALRVAQRGMLADGDPRLRHPRFWSPFRVQW